jgi:hypothetical protein
MPAFQIIPKEVENAFGPDGAEKFITFLNQGFENQKINIIQSVTDSFHDHVTTEISKVRLEIADLRTELKTDIAHVETKISDLRTELKMDIAHVETKISDLRAEMKTDFTDVHKAISGQTKWILAALIGGAVLYPISIKLIDKLFPTSPSAVIVPPVTEVK